jgi:hypothetical protein
MITLATKHNTKGLIFTFCYDHPSDQKFINKISACVSKVKGQMHFVQLICSKRALAKRIQSESRKQYRKVKDLNSLERMFEKYDLFSQIPNSNSLSIDNTNIPAKQAVQMIIDQYSLEKI